MFWDNFKKICDEKGLKPTPVLKECGIKSIEKTSLWGRLPEWCNCEIFKLA